MDALFIQPSLCYPTEQIAGRHQSIRQIEAYIEIGMLSIASFLEAKGLKVNILNLAAPGKSLSDLATAIRVMKPRLVAIPCMSGYSYPSLCLYSTFINEISPSTFIITGGQHSGPLGSLVLEEAPHVDCVVQYEGEVISWLIFDSVVNGNGRLEDIPGIIFRQGNSLVRTPSPEHVTNMNELSFLNYRLFPEFDRYVPRLEESRGCPYDCLFCSNAAVFTRQVRYKSVERLTAELCSIHKQYREPKTLRFYLIAKNYGINRDITLEWLARIKELPFRIEWRTQSTIDVFDPEMLPALSQAGLRMIDFGLESASPRMLQLMNKTSCDPKAYLEKAEVLFRAAARCRATRLKINLIFYLGETSETIAETLEFLFRWRSSISGVTASPVMIDPGGPLARNTEYFEENHGTKVVRNKFWDSLHIYPADLSRDISFQQANMLATLISKMFQTKEDYFVTRQFGGLRPGMDISEFDEEMKSVPPSLRPFLG